MRDARLAAVAIFIVVAIQALAPVRSYDFFWHLATGRWIVDHHTLPVTDPFALASAKIPWINGEWLYEVVLYAASAVAGINAISWLNAVFVASLFTLAFWLSSRRRDFGVALFAAAVAFAGGAPLLGVRPAAAAALLIMMAVGILDSPLSIRAQTIAFAIVTIVWMNTHPSALLAPLIAATTLITDWRRWPVPFASAAALFVNPFGWKAIAAPFQLTHLIGSGEFVNAEWVASTPEHFPVLFATIAAVIVLDIFARPKREDLWRIVVFIGLAFLAVQHVRNQGLYFAPLALLIPPITLRRPRVSLIIAVLAILPLALYRAEHHGGIDDERFPVRAVARLKTLGLHGNIYNVDQFGGYLEWTFYPARRVVTDGRNELFRDFIALDAKARRDSRVWHAMQSQYKVDIAVDEYGTDRIEVVDVASGEHRFLPPSLVRYRRREWALVAFDDATMVFARRAAFPPNIIDAAEYRYLVPDDPFIGYLTPEFRDGARRDIERARKEIGDVEVVKRLAEGAK